MRSLAIICVTLGALVSPVAFCAAAQAPAREAPAGRLPADKSTGPGKSGRVNSRVDLAVDVITGSSELPKVLYIVPWRAATAVPGIDAVPNLVDQQLFKSLDPDAHARLLHYRQLLGEHVAEEK